MSVACSGCRFGTIPKRHSFFVKTLDICSNCAYNIDTVRTHGGGRLNIIISNTSPQPLYEQVEEQIKRAILSGELAPGEALPSIRYLARELRVSIITAKRAYDDLERDGFVQTTQGKGTFVSLANLDRLREVAMSQIEEKLAEAVGAAKAIGLGLEEFQQIIEELYREA